MPEVISNTSPLQYFHQLELLPVLRALTGNVIVPPAVLLELEAGQSLGLNVPDVSKLDWVSVRLPDVALALPISENLGPGEADALRLALESNDPLVLLDDAAARRTAASLGIRIRGTLGLLLDAKNRTLVRAVAPLLDRLEQLGFRMSARTRADILDLAGEAPA